MAIMKLAAVAAVIASTGQVSRAELCEKKTVDFLFLAGDQTHANIVDDIKSNLAKINIDVVPRGEGKDQKNSDMTSGNFDMVFSETWGAPCKSRQRAVRCRPHDEGPRPILHYPHASEEL